MTPRSSRRVMRLLARKKLDEIGNQWRAMSKKWFASPNGGWVRAIREGLGMSQADLARRMGVRTSSVAKLERSERAGVAQLGSLRRAAEALECDLVCVLVPRRPLQDVVDERRVELLSEIWDKTDLHMRLSGLETSDPSLCPSLLSAAEDLVPDGLLWRNDAAALR